MAEMERQKFCEECGAPLKETAKFCEHCGTPVRITPPAPAESIPAAPVCAQPEPAYTQAAQPEPQPVYTQPEQQTWQQPDPAQQQNYAQQEAYRQTYQAVGETWQPQGYAQSAQPPKKSKTGLVIGLVAAALVVIAAVVVLVVLKPFGGLSKEDKLLVGTWRMSELIRYNSDDLEDYDYYDMYDEGYTMVLKEDRTGTITVGTETYQITWEYVGIDEDGDYEYDATVDGGEATLYYITESGEAWVVGDYTIFTFVK